MTPEYFVLSEFLSVPDGTYYPRILKPESPHFHKDLLGKIEGDGSRRITFRKEEIPMYHLLEEQEDGRLVSGGDIFYPSCRLAKDSDDFQLIYDREFKRKDYENDKIGHHNFSADLILLTKGKSVMYAKTYEGNVDVKDSTLHNTLVHFLDWLSEPQKELAQKTSKSFVDQVKQPEDLTFAGLLKDEYQSKEPFFLQILKRGANGLMSGRDRDLAPLINNNNEWIGTKGAAFAFVKVLKEKAIIRCEVKPSSKQVASVLNTTFPGLGTSFNKNDLGNSAKDYQAYFEKEIDTLLKKT